MKLAELPDGDVVVSLGNGEKALVLNAVGASVLELCDGVHGVVDIVAILCETFPGIDPQGAERDVRQILTDLAQEGAID